MSDDNDFTDEGEGIKGLRKQYAETQKELTEARKLLGEFQTAQRTQTVAEILKAKGVPASAATLYNGEDASEDAVGKWLEAHADVFQIKTEATAVTDANAQSAERVASASYGTPSIPSVSSNDQGQVIGNPEEIRRLLDTQPYEELQRLGLMPKSGLYGAR